MTTPTPTPTAQGAAMTEEQRLADELEFLGKTATPGPWIWQTGSSWRRIGSKATHKDGDVLCPYLDRHDRHPDLSIPNPNDAALLLFARNNLPTIIAALRDADRLRSQVREAERVRAEALEALEFYSRPHHWESGVDEEDGTFTLPPAVEDAGEIARQAVLALAPQPAPTGSETT